VFETPAASPARAASCECPKGGREKGDRTRACGRRTAGVTLVRPAPSTTKDGCGARLVASLRA